MFPFSISHSKVMNMEFSSKISQELIDLGFFKIWYKHQVRQVVLCIQESATYNAYQSFYLSTFLSFLQFFHLISSASMSATVFKLCIHKEDTQVHFCKQNQGAQIFSFCLLLMFPFFYLLLQCNEYENFRQRFRRNYLT